MTELHRSIAEIKRPLRIARLPLDRRGFPVPWFADNDDHRIVDARKFAPALNRKLCWICGEPLGRTFAFLIGPMCVITRTISEPPAHRECCEYTVRACPFLSRSQAHRRPTSMPEDVVDAAGLMIKRNPGVTCIWVTRSFNVFRPSGGGILFRIGDPVEMLWFAEGLPATAAEVHSSVYSGLPLLYADAEAQDRFERNADRRVEYALAARVAACANIWPV